MTIIIQAFSGLGPFTIHQNEISVEDLKTELESLSGIPSDMQKLIKGGHYLQDKENVCTGGSFTVIQLSLSLLGGKGGFGANLKRLGGRMSRKGASNYEACRDLSGRRLRTLHDAQK